MVRCRMCVTERTGMRVVKAFVLAVLVTVVLAVAAVVLADGRVALVFGNSTYAHIGRLPNPENDAVDISSALRRLGFEVISSCSACPCHRAVATTPPKWVSRVNQGSAAHAAFAFRLQARPSEYTLEATSAFTSRYGPMTRNLPKGDLVDRLQKFGFPPPCYPSYGAPDSCPGGIVPIGANLFSERDRRILTCACMTRRPARWTRTGMCCCRSCPGTGGSWRGTPGR